VISQNMSPEKSEAVVFEGGCHCQRVRFRVRVAKLEAIDCNCSICKMKGFLHLIVTKDDFSILSGAENLTTYTFNTNVAKHTFCSTCGIHPFYIPRSHPNGIDVNVHCLDGAPVSQFVIRPFDGANWESAIDSIDSIR
jgi:hypothetical protein